MSSTKFDVIVLGSGPGGYEAAIRASQLGLKTAVVEAAELGGICLNWGCIPTKALIKSAQVFEYINHAEDYGISVDNASVNFENIIKRSRNVADGMSKGIQFLFKKNKIEKLMGWGKVQPGKKVEVEDKDGNKTVYSADNIIIATGGRSKELPALKIDNEKIVGYRKAMTLDKLPKKMVEIGRASCRERVCAIV